MMTGGFGRSDALPHRGRQRGNNGVDIDGAEKTGRTKHSRVPKPCAHKGDQILGGYKDQRQIGRSKNAQGICLLQRCVLD